MTMTETATAKERLLDLVNRLGTELRALPPSEPLQRALYHSERLQRAIRTSHSEGIRFAAFTVARGLRDHEAEMTPEANQCLRMLKEELRAAGFDLEK
jgi:hypothetical protein